MTTGGNVRPRGAALFDVDGTLVDSNYLHVNAWQRTFHDIGQPVDAWRIHHAIGMGSPQLLSFLLGEAAGTLGDQAKRLHSDFYRQASSLLRPFDRARDLIAEVARRGAAVVLATSAAPDELAVLRSVLDVDEFLSAITSSADVEVAKPEPALVHVALDRAGVQADHAVFVGDAVWDVLAANRAGIPCVGLLSGGISAAELTDSGAVAVYDDAAALLRVLDQSPLARLWAEVP
jgi:HAD superfamily hydrolase (TIGR01509 family)